MKYQLVLVGIENSFKAKIVDSLIKQVKELGLSTDLINILDRDKFFNYDGGYIPKSPTVCLYFGGVQNVFPDEEILDKLILDACFIIPVAAYELNFTKFFPKNLHLINGFKLLNENQISSLVNRILEGFSLLRESRRLFISYVRKESSEAALQLYEYLDSCGFDVFLDTHSVKPGENFQDELWHRLVDSDILILLRTPGFKESKWAEAEREEATARGVGMVNIIWPNEKVDKSKDISLYLDLNKEDFEQDIIDSSGKLKHEILEEIVNILESFRARCLSSRQDNLIEEFLKAARDLKIRANLQPEKYISIIKNNGDFIEIVPTVGVPHAYTYYKSEDFIKAIRNKDIKELYILFDELKIKEKWMKHLGWLDKHLPIKSIKIKEAVSFLKKIQNDFSIS